MKIAVLGSPQRVALYKQSKPAVLFTEVSDAANINDFDVFIDLDFDTHGGDIKPYAMAQNWVLLSCVSCQIEERMAACDVKFTGQKFLGINAIPGFLQRHIMEFCNPFSADLALFNWQLLGYETAEQVASRVGLASPRVVFMIVNEAYYTVQEGTATKADIDTAMKLGTAYPQGPFEWVQTCGIAAIYHTLQALWADTHDERYKVCPLLKTEYLKDLIS